MASLPLLVVYFLYREEWERWERRKTLTRMQVARSREPNSGAFRDSGCYVQDLLRESWAEQCERLITEEAHVNICGDGTGMAKGVYEAFVEILMKYMRWEREDALVFLKQMQQSGRYLTDCWTILR